MRKLVFLGVIAAALIGAAVAYAASDTVTYSASITPKKAGKKPVNITYQSVLTDRGPGGTAPHGPAATGPSTELFYPKQLVENGKKFPSPCKASDIDNKATIPSKCNAALIGTGTATATAGAPGSAISPATQEQLTVKFFNANKGKSVLLVINGTTPFPVHNRVIPGVLTKVGGKWASKVVFTIPADLRTVPGTSIPSNLTDLSETVKATHKGVGILQLKSCPKSHKLPSQVIAHFSDGSSVTATTTIACS